MSVKKRVRLKQGETLSDYISEDLSNLGPPRNRSVRLKTKFSDRKILQLEGRPTVSSHGCVSTEVAQHASTRSSFPLPNCKSDSKINRAPSRHDFDHPIVDKSSVVSPNSRTSGSKPNKIPFKKKLLTNPKEDMHPLLTNKTLKLIAWRISGKIYKIREYQRVLPNLSLQPEALAPGKIMSPPRENSIAGVLGEKFIHFDVIYQIY